MRPSFIRPCFPGLLLLAGLAAAATASHAAMAQVTVNPGALELLPAAPRPQRPARPPAEKPPTARTTTPAKPSSGKPPTTTTATPAAPAAPGATPPAATATAPAAKPALPVIPPAIAALPPPSPVPAPRPQTAPVVPVAADAPGNASPVPGGVRVTFGTERQDLNPVTEAALRDLARGLRSKDQSINIFAYASGTAEDPSTARRLSLGRALAARAVLINEGIASTRIYPRALGTAGGDTDKDRVDVVAGTPGPPAPAAPAVIPR